MGHTQVRILHHQLQILVDFPQILQCNQGHKGTEARCENTHIHKGIYLLRPANHCHQGIEAFFQRKTPVRHRTVAMGREIETHRGCAEKSHFLHDVHQNITVFAAAKAVDADDAPPGRTILRLLQNAGNLKAVFFQDKSSFHIFLPESKLSIRILPQFFLLIKNFYGCCRSFFTKNSIRSRPRFSSSSA